jgi:uncharacterized protein YybS (DUF2232 family)
MVVLVFFFLLQGLAVCHAVVANRSLHIGWLIGLYVLMTIAMPQMTALLALTGFVDCWLDIRVRFAKPQNAQQHDEQDGSN